MGTLGNAVMQNEAADAQRDAAREAKKREDLLANRRRTDALRQRRIAGAQTAVTGEGQGVADSSGISGAIDSNNAQYASNLGLSLELDAISDQQSKRLGNASRMQGYASIFGAVGSAASGLSSYNWGGGSKATTTAATGGTEGIQTGPTSGPKATVF